MAIRVTAVVLKFNKKRNNISATKIEPSLIALATFFIAFSIKSDCLKILAFIITSFGIVCLISSSFLLISFVSFIVSVPGCFDIANKIPAFPLIEASPLL